LLVVEGEDVRQKVSGDPLRIPVCKSSGVFLRVLKSRDEISVVGRLGGEVSFSRLAREEDGLGG
jgi:hypothetical protein